MITLEPWQAGIATLLGFLVMLIITTKIELPKNTTNKMGLTLFMLILIYVLMVIVNGVFYLFGCTL